MRRNVSVGAAGKMWDWKQALRHHGAFGALLYHVIHYCLLLVLCLLAYAAPFDFGSAVATVGALIGVEVSSHASKWLSAYAVAAVGVKVAIPLKVWLTLRLLPQFERLVQRLWRRRDS